MGFTLTPDTDPSTIMFEGQPDTIITKIMPRMPAACTAPGQLYIVTDRSSRAYNANGTRATGEGIGPLIVQRNVLHPALPIIGTTKQGESFRYKLVGTFLPADGSEPVLHVNPVDRPGGVLLKIYGSTGKTTGEQGTTGMDLTFSNGPLVETESNLVALRDGTLIRLDVTRTDDTITSIEWNK